MYKETLKRKPLRGFGTFLSILTVVFIILLLMLLVGWAQIQLNIGYLQYILLAGVLSYLLAMLIWQLTKYDYAISEGKVLISRGICERKRLLFECTVRQVTAIGCPNEVHTASDKKKRQFLFANNEKEAFFIALERDVLVLAPTEAFIQKLKEEYEKTHC